MPELKEKAAIGEDGGLEKRKIVYLSTIPSIPYQHPQVNAWQQIHGNPLPYRKSVHAFGISIPEGVRQSLPYREGAL